MNDDLMSWLPLATTPLPTRPRSCLFASNRSLTNAHDHDPELLCLLALWAVSGRSHSET